MRRAIRLLMGHPLRILLRRHWAHVIRSSGLFSAEFYLRGNPDVAHARVDPAWHYVVFGAREWRDPHPLFSTPHYLRQCPPGMRAPRNALLHYLRSGARKGLSPHPLFDPEFYLRQTAHSAAALANPLRHYLEHGERMGFDPHVDFHVRDYLRQHPELAAGGQNALVHFLEHDPRWSRHYGPGEAQPVAAVSWEVFASRFPAAPHPLVLLVAHRYGGGTWKHLEEVRALLEGRARTLQMTPGGPGLLLQAGDAAQPLALPVHLPGEQARLIRLLHTLGLSRVLIQHVMDFPPELGALLRELGVPFDFTVHDYFGLCPQTHMVDRRHRYCGEPSDAGCNRCIAARPTHGATDIGRWRREHAWLFQEAQRVACPSRDVAARLSRYYPGARVVVVSNPAPSAAPPAPARRLEPGDALRIAVLGALASSKGAPRLLDLAREARRTRAALEFSLVGYSEPPIEAHLRNLGCAVTGRYRAEELPELIRSAAPDVVWFPAACPETFSYTLSEALSFGLPVVVPGLGAFPERVAGRAWSWVSDWNLPASQVARFFSLIRERHFIAGVPPALTDLPQAQTRAQAETDLPQAQTRAQATLEEFYRYGLS